jgi:hypothetical protein
MFGENLENWQTTDRLAASRFVVEKLPRFHSFLEATHHPPLFHYPKQRQLWAVKGKILQTRFSGTRDDLAGAS